MKIYFRTGGKIKRFLDKRNLAEFVDRRPHLKELLEGDLHKEGEMISEGNLKCQEWRRTWEMTTTYDNYNIKEGG